MFIYDELVTGGNSKGHLTFWNHIDRLLLLWDTGQTGWFMRMIAWSMLWWWRTHLIWLLQLGLCRIIRKVEDQKRPIINPESNSF